MNGLQELQKMPVILSWTSSENSVSRTNLSSQSSPLCPQKLVSFASRAKLDRCALSLRPLGDVIVPIKTLNFDLALYKGREKTKAETSQSGMLESETV